MDQILLNQSWQSVVNSVKRAAESITFQIFPELAKQAEQEAEQFGNLPPPTTLDELNSRFFQATQLNATWGHKFTMELLRYRVSLAEKKNQK